MVALAIESGIAPSAWWAEDDATIATALDIIERERERQQGATRPAGRRVDGG